MIIVGGNYSRMRSLRNNCVLFSVVILLSSCAVPKIFKKSQTQSSAHVNNKTKFSAKLYGVKGSPRVTTSKTVRKGGGRYQVGKPYKIKNKWYYPKEQPGYNKTGMASWYGPNFHGRLTANGEVYDQYSLSAAHPTLPLPSYAKVTNLENGSSVIVRINDRGPFSSKRIIDLSAQASQMLGYQKKGLTKVRVRYIGKARMDGRDAKYLMASYKGPGGQRIFAAAPTFSPNPTNDGTVLASATMPSPIYESRTSTNPRQPEFNAYSTASVRPRTFILPTAESFIPIPLSRPTPIYSGFDLNLASTSNIIYGRLQPISYLRATSYNLRISRAFAAIERFEKIPTP